jgi:hypothetical protein
MATRWAARLAIVCLVVAGCSPAAAAPNQLKVHQQIDISATPDRVWGIISSFSDLTWLPPIKKSSATNGNTPGSVRTLDLGGPILKEQLVSYDAAKMTYSYKFTDDPANLKVVPAGDYQSTITVKKGPHGTSRVVWDAKFHRADPSATPASGMDDASAVKAVTGIYTGGLSALKQKAES